MSDSSSYSHLQARSVMSPLSERPLDKRPAPADANPETNSITEVDPELPVSCRRHRSPCRMRINQQRQERHRYLSTDQPVMRNRSLLSRSRVHRAIEAARRVGGGLIVAALNVGSLRSGAGACANLQSLCSRVSSLCGLQCEFDANASGFVFVVRVFLPPCAGTTSSIVHRSN